MAFDAGWPCTLHEYGRLMKSVGLRYDDLAWAVVSHMHMDHAGLLGEFQHSGVECFVLEEQFQGIDTMEAIILKNQEYREYRRINPGGLRRVTVDALNEVCRDIQVPGQVIPTPGHSSDSVTFLTHDHEALIGDLYPPDQLMPDDAVSWASWALIESRGAQRVFPSHGEVFDL